MPHLQQLRPTETAGSLCHCAVLHGMLGSTALTSLVDPAPMSSLMAVGTKLPTESWRSATPLSVSAPRPLTWSCRSACSPSNPSAQVRF